MRVHGRARAGATAAVLFAALLTSTGPTSATPGGPTVTGPIGGGTPVVATTFFDLSRVGYQQAEFFLSGTATAYAPTAPLTSNGKWSVAPSSTSPYTTRAVVYRPADPKRFNGTVVVEWLNVSGGLDAGPDWTFAHDELVRRGAAWVGVSAQAVGLNATKAANPTRYAPLSHPGDSYSYDIFSQAGRAVRDQARTLLGGLKAHRVLAAGESQSAIRMVTYLDAVQPIAQVYDGFLVHSRFAGGAAISQAPLPSTPVPSPAQIRDDLHVPVLVTETETDVGASNLGERQADSANLRLWEMAGTAHADTYNLSVGFGDTGGGHDAAPMFATMLHPPSSPIPGIIDCGSPINAGPQHWVVESAFSHLDQWVRTGAPPPTAARLDVASTSPVVFKTDGLGNVLGGIRTPQVATPVAKLSGAGQSGAGFCGLFGTTVPLTPAQLGTQYGTKARFVTEWREAAHAAVRAGFVLRADEAPLKAVAPMVTGLG